MTESPTPVHQNPTEKPTENENIDRRLPNKAAKALYGGTGGYIIADFVVSWWHVFPTQIELTPEMSTKLVGLIVFIVGLLAGLVKRIPLIWRLFK
jgi:hypothetical protein